MLTPISRKKIFFWITVGVILFVNRDKLLPTRESLDNDPLTQLGAWGCLITFFALLLSFKSIEKKRIVKNIMRRIAPGESDSFYESKRNIPALQNAKESLFPVDKQITAWGNVKHTIRLKNGSYLCVEQAEHSDLSFFTLYSYDGQRKAVSYSHRNFLSDNSYFLFQLNATEFLCIENYKIFLLKIHENEISIIKQRWLYPVVTKIRFCDNGTLIASISHSQVETIDVKTLELIHSSHQQVRPWDKMNSGKIVKHIQNSDGKAKIEVFNTIHDNKPEKSFVCPEIMPNLYIDLTDITVLAENIVAYVVNRKKIKRIDPATGTRSRIQRNTFVIYNLSTGNHTVFSRENLDGDTLVFTPLPNNQTLISKDNYTNSTWEFFVLDNATLRKNEIELGIEYDGKKPFKGCSSLFYEDGVLTLSCGNKIHVTTVDLNCFKHLADALPKFSLPIVDIVAGYCKFKLFNNTKMIDKSANINIENQISRRPTE
ncbi:MAG: hypothetical protein ACYCQI_13725 [Gammaproteobacteria bacterium]